MARGHASQFICEVLRAGAADGLSGAPGSNQISPAGEVSMSSPRGRDVLADDAGFLPDEPDVPAWPGGPSKILSGMDTKCNGFYSLCYCYK